MPGPAPDDTEVLYALAREFSYAAQSLAHARHHNGVPTLHSAVHQLNTFGELVTQLSGQALSRLFSPGQPSPNAQHTITALADAAVPAVRALHHLATATQDLVHLSGCTSPPDAGPEYDPPTDYQPVIAALDQAAVALLDVPYILSRKPRPTGHPPSVTAAARSRTTALSAMRPRTSAEALPLFDTPGQARQSAIRHGR